MTDLEQRSRTTTVAIVDAPGEDFTFAEVALDGPRADEVPVRIVATGLCHTDITMSGFLPPEMFPNVFGHKGAGAVEEVGSDVAGIGVGDHVVLSFRSCRTCARCTPAWSATATPARSQLHGRADGWLHDVLA